MGFLDKILGNEQKSGLRLDELNLEKPLVIDLVKGMKSLDLNKPDVLAGSYFLIDVSGSMSDTVKRVRKIDSVREVMAMIPTAKKICFSDNIHTSGDIPEPNGGTRMDRAFEYLSVSNPTELKKIVLVSDGEPNSKTSAMNAALRLKLPVDVIYIGEEGDSGERFMKELADKTGGKQLTM